MSKLWIRKLKSNLKLKLKRIIQVIAADVAFYLTNEVYIKIIIIDKSLTKNKINKFFENI